MILYEVDGKLIVGQKDPDPLRCPSCHRFFHPPVLDGASEIRCPFCSKKGNVPDFETEYRQIAKARVLAFL